MAAPTSDLVSRRTARPGRILAMSAAVLILFTAMGNGVNNSNVRSRLATAESLVERGTLAIDESPYISTIDKVFVGGHFYSEKPVLLSLLAAAIYYPLHAAGFRLRPGAVLAPLAITLLIMSGSYLLCLWCFYEAVGRVGVAEPQQALMTEILAFGTLLLPWSTVLNNHAFAGAWLWIGFYCWWRSRQEARTRWFLLLSGGAFSLASAADYSVTPFFVAFCGYSLWVSKPRRNAVYMLLPVVVTLAASLVVNDAISGSFKPMQTRPELFMYPGSYWLSAQEQLSGVRFNSVAFTIRYTWELLFGGNGFLLYNPFLFLTLGLAAGRIVRREPLWAETTVALTVSAGFVLYYGAATSNYAGWSYSVRWFVALIPLLWFFSYSFFLDFTPAKHKLVAGSFAISVVISLVGAIDPWTPTRPAFLANLGLIYSRLR
jgi:hypothetical protein